MFGDVRTIIYLEWVTVDDTTWKILFNGRVQGVGFRYFVNSVANDFPVTGYVKNLSSGSVEVLVSGHYAALESFLNEIKNSAPGQIDQVNVDREFPSSHLFDNFFIRK